MWFFAGFCLIANGAYVSGGALVDIGDSKVMFQTGTPKYLMLLFGVTAASIGLLFWHRLGDLQQFLKSPNASLKVNGCMAVGLLAWLAIAALLGR